MAKIIGMSIDCSKDDLQELILFLNHARPDKTKANFVHWLLEHLEKTLKAYEEEENG